MYQKMDNQINEYTQLGFRFFSFLSMTAIKNSNDKYIKKAYGLLTKEKRETIEPF